MENMKIDKASYRNRGGILQRIISFFKLRRCKAGHGVLVRLTADITLTDGAILEFGDNCSVLSYAFFQLTKPSPKVYIGNNTVIGRHSMITCKNLIRIGSNVLMGSYVQVIDHNHGIARDRPIVEQRADIGEVIIGDDVWIGAGVKILNNVHIGRGAVIGSNAVVTSDVPEFAIVGGVPARLIGYRE